MDKACQNAVGRSSRNIAQGADIGIHNKCVIIQIGFYQVPTAGFFIRFGGWKHLCVGREKGLCGL